MEIQVRILRLCSLHFKNATLYMLNINVIILLVENICPYTFGDINRPDDYIDFITWLGDNIVLNI